MPEQKIPPASVLVVDDIDMNRELLAAHLEQQGYVAEMAENGREALRMLAKQPFDLVLLDVMMPVMDGHETLQRLKSDPLLRHIPVVMISALSELDSVVRAIQNGAEDYLPKPFNPILLRARVGACIEKKRLHDREAAYLAQIEKEKARTDALLHAVIPIGVALSGETDFNRLLDRILEEAMKFCSADAGLLMLRTEDERLQHVLLRCGSLDLAMAAGTGDAIPFEPLQLDTDGSGEARGEQFLAAYVAQSGESVVIADHYAESRFNVGRILAFDRQTGYRSVSSLTVPLKNNAAVVIGVLQLVNAQDPATGEVGPFEEGMVEIVESLSALATVSLEAYKREQRLRKQIEELRIEIDHVQAARQVQEIVETDYFSNLRARARELRQAAKGQ